MKSAVDKYLIPRRFATLITLEILNKLNVKDGDIMDWGTDHKANGFR